MIPGVNPRQMKQMMKRMGMEQQDIEATEVIIRTPTTDLVFTNPQVARVHAMGQDTYQIVGTPQEQSRDQTSAPLTINDEDVETVVSQAGVSESVAREAIITHEGDLAAAILELNESKEKERDVSQ